MAREKVEYTGLGSFPLIFILLFLFGLWLSLGGRRPSVCAGDGIKHIGLGHMCARTVAEADRGGSSHHSWYKVIKDPMEYGHPSQET